MSVHKASAPNFLPDPGGIEVVVRDCTAIADTLCPAVDGDGEPHCIHGRVFEEIDLSNPLQF